MIKAREKEQNISLICCIPIAKLFPSSFAMSWFSFLQTAEHRRGKDLSSYRTDIPVVHFSSTHQRCTTTTASLPSEYTKQQGEEDEFITWITPGLQKQELSSEDGRNSLSHLLAKGTEKENKSAIADNLFLKLQLIPYLLSLPDLR